MSLFNGGSKTTTTNTPWGPAAGHMQGAMDKIAGQEWQQYGGPWSAGMNPYMQGTIDQGYAAGQQMLGASSGMYGNAMNQYGQQLDQMRNLGPQRFQYDQGTANQVMNQMSGGLTSQANLAGLMSSRNLDSQLGQLMGAAGTSGQFGTALSSKLAGGAAQANALSREALQGQIQNMYQNAAGAASNAGMTAGGANMQSAIGNQGAMLNGYGNMGKMGLAGMSQGLNAMNAAGRTQYAFDQSQVQGGLAEYQNNLFGQQQFYQNQFNPAFSAANAFKTTDVTTQQQMSGLGQIGAVAGLAGSIYGGISGAGGFSNLGNNFMNGAPTG